MLSGFKSEAYLTGMESICVDARSFLALKSESFNPISTLYVGLKIFWQIHFSLKYLSFNSFNKFDAKL